MPKTEDMKFLCVVTRADGIFLGKLHSKGDRSVTLSHVVCLTGASNGQGVAPEVVPGYKLIPVPLPLDLLDAAGMDEVKTEVNTEFGSMETYLPIDAPHEICKMYRHYWGME